MTKWRGKWTGKFISWPPWIGDLHMGLKRPAYPALHTFPNPGVGHWITALLQSFKHAFILLYGYSYNLLITHQ